MFLYAQDLYTHQTSVMSFQLKLVTFKKKWIYTINLAKKHRIMWMCFSRSYRLQLGQITLGQYCFVCRFEIKFIISLEFFCQSLRSCIPPARSNLNSSTLSFQRSTNKSILFLFDIFSRSFSSLFDTLAPLIFFQFIPSIHGTIRTSV